MDLEISALDQGPLGDLEYPCAEDRFQSDSSRNTVNVSHERNNRSLSISEEMVKNPRGQK